MTGAAGRIAAGDMATGEVTAGEDFARDMYQPPTAAATTSTPMPPHSHIGGMPLFMPAPGGVGCAWMPREESRSR
jgi:hypothetical protein